MSLLCNAYISVVWGQNSVYPSVKQGHCDKKKEATADFPTPYESIYCLTPNQSSSPRFPEITFH